MRRHWARAASLCVLAIGCTVGEEVVETRESYLALVALDAPLEATARIIEESGAIFERHYGRVGVVRFRATERQLTGLVTNEALVAIEPVIGRELDRVEFRPSPNELTNTQVEPWGVARLGGSQAPTARALWVLDTGVDLYHPDLNVDADLSIDLVAQFDDAESDADTSHGTAVAGVAAAIDNQRDVVGVAPGTRVVSVRVLDSGGSGRSDILVAGLDYAAERANRGDVVNLSLAGRGHSEILETALARVAGGGLLITVAAGNEASDAGEYTPAAVEAANVWTVSAIGQDDCLASFSNHGSAVDVAAPGQDILTLRPGGGTVVVDGTSFAAPHVAGLLLADAFSAEGRPCLDLDRHGEPIAVAD